jgi:hypothetical protein
MDVPRKALNDQRSSVAGQNNSLYSRDTRLRALEAVSA